MPESKNITQLEQDKKLSESYEKLARKKYDIQVPRDEGLIYVLKRTLTELQKSENKDEVDSEIKKAEQRLIEAENDVIKATFVPLSAMDMLTVQSYVAEAAIRAEEAAFAPGTPSLHRIPSLPSACIASQDRR